MSLQRLLQENRETIVKSWRDAIFSSYPGQAARFLSREADQFANPVGHTINENIGPIFDQIVDGIDSEKATVLLDAIVRVRAVQEFTASEAVAFLFTIKPIVRDLCRREAPDGFVDELIRVESRIDAMALLGFDIYMRCREKMYQIRTNEARRRTEKLVERLTREAGIAGGEADSDNIS